MRPSRSSRSRLALIGAAVVALIVTVVSVPLGAWPGFIGQSQAAVLAPPPVAGVSPGAEIQTMGPAQLATYLDAIVASGATWIRVDLFWPVVEPRPGVFDWSEPDPVIRGARLRGLHVLAIPDYTPNWAASAGDPVAFSAFLTAAAQHYRPLGVQNWEIWNEPNLASNWAPVVDPAAYTTTLKAAHTALRAVEPNAVVTAGALSPALDAADRSQLSPLSFVQAMYASGAQGYFEALSVHPSSFPDMPMTPDSWNTFYNLPQLHQAMVARDDGAKKIWLTEYGAPTGTAREAVSESTQADMIYQAYGAAARWPWAGPVFTYGQDAGADLSNEYDNFGISRFDGSAKPAYSAFEAAIGMPARAGWTPSPAKPDVAQLSAGQTLLENQRLTNKTTGWDLAMQSDGNLVLYDSSGAAHWASNTWGNAGAHALMQGDGNLVVYSAAGSALWASNSYGHSGALSALRDDNNLVVGYPNGPVLWATGTS